jgi:hypothetical protein
MLWTSISKSTMQEKDDSMQVYDIVVIISYNNLEPRKE